MIMHPCWLFLSRLVSESHTFIEPVHFLNDNRKITRKHAQTHINFMINVSLNLFWVPISTPFNINDISESQKVSQC